MKLGTIASLLLVLLAGACATPAQVGNMTVATPQKVEPKDPALTGATYVRNVTGGEETNPLWTSEVDNAGFKGALEKSLLAQDLAATDSTACKFNLDANLLSLKQPIVGFNITVGSHVNYEVTKADSGELYFAHSQNADYTATVGQAFLGFERLRLANEGSNIKRFLQVLMAHMPVA